MEKIPDEFNIDLMYKHYLDLVRLSEELMHPTQKIETKRAFVAGMVELVAALTDPKVSDEMAINGLGYILSQTKNFLGNELLDQN